jgi:hypothetical protein
MGHSRECPFFYSLIGESIFSQARLLPGMKKLFITDRNSDSSRQSVMKIKRNIPLDRSAELTVTEIMPWIRLTLTYDESIHDTWKLITEFRKHGFVAAEG